MPPWLRGESPPEIFRACPRIPWANPSFTASPHLPFGAHLRQQGLQLGDLAGLGGVEVPVLAEIGAEVVKFPGLVVGRVAIRGIEPRGNLAYRTGFRETVMGSDR